MASREVSFYWAELNMKTKKGRKALKGYDGRNEVNPLKLIIFIQIRFFSSNS